MAGRSPSVPDALHSNVFQLAQPGLERLFAFVTEDLLQRSHYDSVQHPGSYRHHQRPLELIKIDTHGTGGRGSYISVSTPPT